MTLKQPDPTEQLVPIIVKALRQISDWPWLTAPGNFITTIDIIGEPNQIVAEVPCQGSNEHDLPYIASSPLWLAQMVVGMVEREVKLTYLACITWGNTYRPTRMVKGKREPNPYYEWGEKEFLAKVLGNLSISSEDWTWLKEKVGE